MTENEAHGMNATILAAEASILKISEELARMKRASDLLEDAGQQSQQLRNATGRLVAEIGSLVELSGQIMTAMNHVDMKGVVSELRTALMQRLDGLEAEVKTGIVEQMKAGDDAVMQRIDAFGSQEAKTASELRVALMQRLDGLAAEVKADIVEHVMAGDNALAQRLDALDSYLAETRSLVERWSKRKGILF